MKREAFKMFLKPGCEAEYERRHAQIWPELKQLLSEPLYNTMAELDEINRNLNRKRGSRNVRKEKE